MALEANLELKARESRGRLKLREQSPGGVQLIAYKRADDRGNKVSRTGSSRSRNRRR